MDIFPIRFSPYDLIKEPCNVLRQPRREDVALLWAIGGASMSLTVITDEPKTLLVAIKKAIDDKRIVTWAYDKDGDFTHSADQWDKKAWLRPSVQQDALFFGILGPKDVRMTKLIYGIYHGRFIEMLLTHFDDRFTTVGATAQGSKHDVFK